MVYIKIEKHDVLIIGSGGAGLRAAIELHNNKVDVLVVGKCEKRDAHTILATGGINAALGNMDTKDSWQLHAADTIKDGGLINDAKAVAILCKNAPAAVKELAKWGARFHREKNGKISQRFFGAATYRRACFVGDVTGKEILNVLVDQTLKRKVPFKSNVYIISLLKKGSKVCGAVGIDIKKGSLIAIQAKAVILATGGHSRMFRRSSSRFWENNGDGIYLAKETGCQFMDMEMFQFHPTGMLWPQAADGVLVTEAVRGEGGILTNTKGERFMKKYDAHRLELSARDVVARAIYVEVTQGKGTKRGGVWLDISHKPLPYIKKRLPLMYSQFKKYAKVDISKKKMEVAPTAHYSMGGIRINHATGSTGIKGLYAIGEVTAGVHGGNRLGGNSLAEITVFGKRTAKQIIKKLRSLKHQKLSPQEIAHGSFTLSETRGIRGKDPITVKQNLQALMWKYAGVMRTKTGLAKALKELQPYKKIKFNTGTNLKMNKKLIAALDVRNMIPTCEMILVSALMRNESRAAHYRSDFKKTTPSWKKNIVCSYDKNGLHTSVKNVPAVPKAIKKLMTYQQREVHLLE